MGHVIQYRSPASFDTLIRLASREGPVTRTMRRVILHQWRYGSSVEAWLGDEPLAALMFYPLSEDTAVLAAVFSPSARAHMVRLVRFAHLTLDQLSQNGVIKIHCEVMAGNRDGERMARLLGFEGNRQSGRIVTYQWKVPHGKDNWRSSRRRRSALAS